MLKQQIKIEEDTEVQIIDGKDFKTDSVKFFGELSCSNNFIVYYFMVTKTTISYKTIWILSIVFWSILVLLHYFLT